MGLTATPGVGRYPGLKPESVVSNLISLCAHMDATSGIRTVQVHTQGLSEVVTKPDRYQDLVCQSEQRQVFAKRIEEEMQDCERFLRFSSNQALRWSPLYEQAVKNKKDSLKGSSNPGDRDKVSSYYQNVGVLYSDTDQVHESTLRSSA